MIDPSAEALRERKAALDRRVWADPCGHRLYVL